MSEQEEQQAETLSKAWDAHLAGQNIASMDAQERDLLALAGCLRTAAGHDYQAETLKQATVTSAMPSRRKLRRRQFYAVIGAAVAAYLVFVPFGLWKQAPQLTVPPSATDQQSVPPATAPAPTASSPDLKSPGADRGETKDSSARSQMMEEPVPDQPKMALEDKRAPAPPVAKTAEEGIPAPRSNRQTVAPAKEKMMDRQVMSVQLESAELENSAPSAEHLATQLLAQPVSSISAGGLQQSYHSGQVDALSFIRYEGVSGSEACKDGVCSLPGQGSSDPAEQVEALQGGGHRLILSWPDGRKWILEGAYSPQQLREISRQLSAKRR